MTTWNDVAKSEQSNSGGNILFLKDGKTVIKIIAPENAQDNVDTSWFYKFTQHSVYQGKESKSVRYLIYAVDMEDKTVKTVLLPKTVMGNIFNLLGEDHRLLDIEDGFPVSIIRTKTGMKVEYTVMPSAKAFNSSEYRTDTLDSFEDTANKINTPKEDKAEDTEDTDIKW